MIFFVAGVRRSASTLATQIACEIAGIEQRLFKWEGRPKYATSSSKKWWVVKAHRPTTNMQAYIDDGFMRVFSTVRDPRDVVVSIMQLYRYPTGAKSSLKEVLARGWIQGDIRAQTVFRKNAGQHYTRIRYEDFHKNIDVLVQKIAHCMDIPITDARSLELADKYSYFNNRERASGRHKDGKGILFPRHVQTGIVGMWKYFLAPEEILMIQEELGEDWFRENGYEIWQS